MGSRDCAVCAGSIEPCIACGAKYEHGHLDLDPVTVAVNTHRGFGHGSESRCPQGHAYEGENLRTWTDSEGYTRRYCRACGIARARAYRRRKAATTWGCF